MDEVLTTDNLRYWQWFVNSVWGHFQIERPARAIIWPLYGDCGCIVFMVAWAPPPKVKKLARKRKEKRKR